MNRNCLIMCNGDGARPGLKLDPLKIPCERNQRFKRSEEQKGKRNELDPEMKVLCEIMNWSTPVWTIDIPRGTCKSDLNIQ